jgi:hypothetical protein
MTDETYASNTNNGYTFRYILDNPTSDLSNMCANSIIKDYERMDEFTESGVVGCKMLLWYVDVKELYD